MRGNPCQNLSSSSEMHPTTPILHIALVEPDIAPNVGTIARLCAATGVRLHLIGRLGFRLNDKAIRRAGLDYWPHVDLEQHADWNAFKTLYPGMRCFGLSARSVTSYTAQTYQAGDCLVFGSETQGLPEYLTTGPQSLPMLTIPMPAGKVRCLNVAMSAGIVTYEALRQLSVLEYRL
jgi:tRNA (cytidine/uridine-2'-O-)-methyltransferase